MKEANDTTALPDTSRKLTDAIRDVKNALADRDDVVVDMREAHRMRLDLLAAELAPVFADVSADIDSFDFVVSSGLQPRLWIDAVSHVAMGRDRRTYRFLKDTRIGRVVLAESTDMKPVVDQVTKYVAERIVERQRMMEGGVEPAIVDLKRPAVQEAEPPLKAVSRPDRWSAFFSVLGLITAGALAGLAVSAILFWDRISAIRISF
ncbi:hypothetical protein ASD44_09965 [Mesorhizobium sp. Root554]|uniref:hypothetical protein n=1 Tax=unclassified Mesorhizobium TaxID=325217 RepID=UPI0006F3C943|nr:MULTISPECIES: hypothetical protein [unclassified Mesorhizobium]KQZ14359.1 hypothetical protein ASD27_09975 [Mesorhizobium sp. Root1471]KQZ36870.1 hypothetical protein ASD44_09965 [Mesorhizobium sp. Root554]